MTLTHYDREIGRIERMTREANEHAKELGCVLRPVADLAFHICKRIDGEQYWYLTREYKDGRRKWSKFWTEAAVYTNGLKGEDLQEAYNGACDRVERAAGRVDEVRIMVR